MSLNLKLPDIQKLKPRITVFGVGGAGGNAVNNMIQSGLVGCDFVAANTDAQALASSKCERSIQMGVAVTEGLGAGSQPEIGRAAAEEVIDEINDHLSGAHMVFITAGMGGGTGTGAAPVVARAAREQGILTVGVVTKPFHFEGQRRMRTAEAGINELQKHVDTLIVIPNQNLFRIANERTTFADAFAMADQVLYSGVACITDLMVKEGLINLDFADVRAVMRGMGKAMMGTGEASGDRRAIEAAEAAIANPLLDETSMRGARGLLISITGGRDLTLYELDEAATRIREEVDQDANIIVGATHDEGLEGIIRVSVVATGIDQEAMDAQAREREEAKQRGRSVRGGGVPTSPAVAPASVPSAGAPAAAPLTAAIAAPALEAALERPPEPTIAAAPAPAPEVYVVPAAVDPGVTIEPVPQIDHHYGADPVAEAEQIYAAPSPQPEPQPYVPPVPQRPVERPRLPRPEDFPRIAQQQLRREPDHAEDERRPRGILARITQSLSRKDDHHHEPAATPPLPAPPPITREPLIQRSTGADFAKPRPLPRAPQEAVQRVVAAHPQQHAPQHHVPPPRPAPVQPRSMDEELEIPAFLRRQTGS